MFVFDIQSIAYYATWIVTITYFCALIPQIFLNYRLKSTSGLSDSMLLIYLTAYGAEVGYVYFLNMPLSYKTMIPLGFIAVLIIVYQRLYYVPDHGSKKFIHILYFINFVFIGLFCAGMYNRMLIGSFAGWIATASFMLAYLPQLVRVQIKKSVHGLSLLFVFMLGVASTTEFIASILLGLPLPSLANGFRGILVSIIFIVQFWMYKKTIVAVENPVLEETQLQ
jgi:uncharacterized protein with PQ loop repeat